MRLSILVKICLIIALVASVVISGTAYINVRFQKELLESIYKDKGVSLANSLNAAINEEDLANSTILQNTIYKFIFLNPDVAVVTLSFRDSQNVLKNVASTNLSLIGLPSGAQVERVFAGHIVTSEHSDAYRDHRLIVYTPIDINGQHVGVNEMHIRIDQAEKSVDHLTQVLSFMFVLSFVGIIVATLLFVYFVVTRHVHRLTEAVLLVGKGDLSKEVPVGSNDEIGDMARGFNQMIHELRSYKDEMEKKIRERTSDLEKRTREVEEINKLMVGREIKMIELKKKLTDLETSLKTKE